jgi:peptidoglycan biosynthesis protein MviN/MurJ (putative lipid II flippase)
MTAFSLTSLLLNFYLSKEDTKIVFLTPIAVILQITGISLFHESIVQVVTVSIAAISMLLTVLLIYFAYGKKGKRKTKAKAN